MQTIGWLVAAGGAMVMLVGYAVSFRMIGAAGVALAIVGIAILAWGRIRSSVAT